MAFGVAYRSYLPSLVRREEVLEGNSKLRASESVAEVVGFGVAGWLVQALTAPVAILIDAVSFLFSAVFVGRINKLELRAVAPGAREGVLREAGEGMRAIGGNPLLRATTVAESLAHLGFAMFGATFILYAVRDLDIPP